MLNESSLFDPATLDQKNKKMRHLSRLKKLKEEHAHSRLKEKEANENANWYLSEMLIQSRDPYLNSKLSNYKQTMAKK